MKVTSYVHTTGKDGRAIVLAPGDTVPEGVEVTNPDALEAPDEGDDAPKRPARKAADS